MLSLADAGGRMMTSGKDLAELAGYTSRVYSLLSALHDLNQGRYENLDDYRPEGEDPPPYDLGSVNGRVVEGEEDVVSFEHVPIVVPSLVPERGGEVLVRDLNLKIRRGEHCLITGPNGGGFSNRL